jgi:hypothetical protein
MARGRTPAPKAEIESKRQKFGEKTAAEALMLYDDLRRRFLVAKKAVEREGAVLTTNKGFSYRSPWCAELDKTHFQMRSLLKDGLFDKAEAKPIDPEDDDVSDLLD